MYVVRKDIEGAMTESKKRSATAGGIIVLAVVLCGVILSYAYSDELSTWFADFMGEERPNTSKTRLDEKCRKGDADACTELAHQLRRKLGNPPDEDRLGAVIHQYQRACKLKEVDSCRWAGQLMLKTKQPDLAGVKRLFQKACDGLDKKGCVLLDDLQSSQKRPM